MKKRFSRPERTSFNNLLLARPMEVKPQIKRACSRSTTRKVIKASSSCRSRSVMTTTFLLPGIESLLYNLCRFGAAELNLLFNFRSKAGVMFPGALKKIVIIGFRELYRRHFNLLPGILAAFDHKAAFGKIL